MSAPGDFVFIVNGTRVERVILVERRTNFWTVLRREPGYPDLQRRDVDWRHAFLTEGEARYKVKLDRSRRAHTLHAQLERLLAWDPDKDPVHDMTNPRKGK